MVDGVPDRELLKAKEFIKGRLQLRMEDTRAVASWMGGQELLRREILTVDEVLAIVDGVSAELAAWRVSCGAMRPSAWPWSARSVRNRAFSVCSQPDALGQKCALRWLMTMRWMRLPQRGHGWPSRPYTLRKSWFSPG